ncbi:MAG: GAF domain-containing protein [Clostridia bacterium]|nr:GAF domain-containing protein [Clostridia bacterium]
MDYSLLISQLEAVTDGVDNNVTNLANAAALLYNSLEDVSWAGFYIADGDALMLGPFQGKAACVRIPRGRGVCGAAFKRGETVVVPNVHEFVGHIACDAASNSEIVIPLFKGGSVYGVLDIDSASLERFSDGDREGLERFTKALEARLV